MLYAYFGVFWATRGYLRRYPPQTQGRVKKLRTQTQTCVWRGLEWDDLSQARVSRSAIVELGNSIHNHSTIGLMRVYHARSMNGLGEFEWKSIAEKVEVENMGSHNVNYHVIESSSPCATTNYPGRSPRLLGWDGLTLPNHLSSISRHIVAISRSRLSPPRALRTVRFSNGSI